MRVLKGLAKPDAGTAGRQAGELANFLVPLLAIEARRLEIERVEIDADAAALAGDLLALPQQPRTGAAPAPGFGHPEPFDIEPIPIGAAADSSLHRAGSVPRHDHHH